MAKITNPILPGFNPDPSICRVGEDYYIATSTFEWYGGVQIHHSRDLVNWRLVARALTRKSQLDMIGNPCSGGIWAPCLSHDGEKFYLIFTDVKTLRGAFKDTPNYLVTADKVEGPWSDPTFLNAGGFDPSLFHDDDGKKWLVNMVWDHREGKNSFGGILLQEYSPSDQKLVGPIRNIFKGSELGSTEGPHLYKRNRYYYLLTAEGGTGPGHAVTMARSRHIDGDYTVDQQNPVLTSKNDPKLELWKAGHASIVETHTGETYMVHLCARPVGKHNRCILGRETAIQRCIWTDDGWLKLDAPTNKPKLIVVGPKIPVQETGPEPVRDDFDDDTFSIHFSTLRILPDESWMSLTQRPGSLRLYGQESPGSRHNQSIVARRVQSLKCRARTRIGFIPESFQQMAGLMAFYSVDNYYYLRMTNDEDLGVCLGIIGCDKGRYEELTPKQKKLVQPRCFMGVEFDHEKLQFQYSVDGDTWHTIGDVLDATRLSDEYAVGWGFTGAFVGMACHDLTGRRLYADFDFFDYEEF